MSSVEMPCPPKNSFSAKRSPGPARRIADAKLELRRRRDGAVGEIAARLGAEARGQRVAEELRGQIHHVIQRLAALLVSRRIRRHGGQRHAGHRGKPFDRFGEADALGLHQERDDVAVLAGGEVVVKSLLVVDREGRRLFLLKRRQPLEFPSRLFQLDAPTHDFRNRKPGAQFVEKLGREAHGVELCLESAACGAEPTMDIGMGWKDMRVFSFLRHYSQGNRLVMAGLDPAIHVFGDLQKQERRGCPGQARA